MAGSASIDVSVVIPVYGGEQTIVSLVERLLEVLSDVGASHEVLLICDRPRDGSWDKARALSERHDAVIAVRLLRNFGQHPATLLGIRRARGAIIVTMDEDLQHSPDDVPMLVEHARAERAVVYGVAQQLQHSWWRNATSFTAKWFLSRYMGVRHARTLTAFRAFPASLREAFADYHGERVAIDVLLSWAGAPVKSVPCAHAPRAEGESGYTFRKLVAYLSDLLMGYTTAPLRMASWIGVISVVVALGIAGYVFVNWLRYGSVVQGFAFLAMSVALFSGVQLLALGLIGEYLGRLYFNSLGKPQYLVAEVAGDEEVDA